MQIRNLKYNTFGTVDMEIEHPTYGWIPFTASPDDTEKYGRELYAAAIAGDFGIIEDADPLLPKLPYTPSEVEVLKTALIAKGILSSADLLAAMEQLKV